MKKGKNEKDYVSTTLKGTKASVRVIILTLMFVLAGVMLAGCKKEEGSEADNTDPSLYEVLDNPTGSTWGSDSGDFIRIIPEESVYILKRESGRVGKGTYYPEDRMISFNGLIYEIGMVDQNNFYLIQNGDSTEADFESIDGMTFGKNDDDSFWAYDAEELNGTWINEDGTTLTIDMGAMEYTAYYEGGFASGTINDDEDGRGLFLSMEDFAYVIMRDDGSLTFDTTDPVFSAKTYIRQEQ